MTRVIKYLTSNYNKIARLERKGILTQKEQEDKKRMELENINIIARLLEKGVIAKEEQNG